jgi:hypothetical protein
LKKCRRRSGGGISNQAFLSNLIFHKISSSSFANFKFFQILNFANFKVFRKRFIEKLLHQRLKQRNETKNI